MEREELRITGKHGTYVVKAVPTEENDLFYSNDEKDMELSCIGHLRADLGRKGKEFRIDTDAHSYYVRGTLTQGVYNLHCYCYQRDMLEQYLANSRLEQEQSKSDTGQGITMAGM